MVAVSTAVLYIRYLFIEEIDGLTAGEACPDLLIFFYELNSWPNYWKGHRISNKNRRLWNSVADSESFKMHISSEIACIFVDRSSDKDPGEV